jgi:hypothetical protein
MPLCLGARLGPYDILSPLGAGGMGEVYRAKDTRLDRDKIISAPFVCVQLESGTALSAIATRHELVPALFTNGRIE